MLDIDQFKITRRLFALNLDHRAVYDRAVSAIAAFVLAGGKSSRMGRDKAFLDLGGPTLLSRALGVAKGVAGEVRIVGDPARFGAFGAVVTDVYSGHGPLGGIHSALSSSNAELNVILAVDLPFVDAQLLKYLVARAEESSASVTVPFVAGHYEPLCALYRREFMTFADSALAQGHNKIDALFSKMSVCTVDEQELSRAGFSPKAFRNVNTPEEWDQAARELKAKRL